MAFSGISATSIYRTQSTQFDPYTLEIQSSKPPNLKQVKNSFSSVPNGEMVPNRTMMDLWVYLLNSKTVTFLKHYLWVSQHFLRSYTSQDK